MSVPQQPTLVNFQMTEEKALTRNRSIGSLGVAFLNTVAITATAHYALGHPGHPAPAIVHGFTTAFEVCVGLMVVAALAVTALLRSRGAAGTDPAQPSVAA